MTANDCLNRCFGGKQYPMTREEVHAVPADEVRRWGMSLLDGSHILFVSTRADAEKICSEINFAMMCEMVAQSQAERKARRKAAKSQQTKSNHKEN